MAETPAGMLLRERDEARALLAEGYAQDWIDQAELDRRLELVEYALTITELRTLTTDVRPVETTALVPVMQAERIPVLFGSVERRGAWMVAPRTQVRVTFGDAVLDLREAVLPAGVTELELEVKVAFGNLEVIVPPGWQIDNRCRAILASVEQDPGGAPGRERRLLRLTGRVVLGSLSVQERLPGAGEREAGQRRRGPQKPLRAAGSRTLPASEDGET
ncbi:MAG: hypothetical protein H0T76_05925 [Nannocystis sp.]|nr:LiaF domain-containing protein [Nannocystis sp.]MBA3545999.1 hypothetical protein [Nannocystis sp.]